MRRIVFACLVLASFAACTGPDSEVVPAQMQWMEWPAEVLASASFEVRLVGYGAACAVQRFDPGLSVDNSAVTFEPFFLVRKPQPICPAYDRASLQAASPSLVIPFFDTLATVGGLPAQTSRSYEIRAAANVSAQAAAPTALPVRTFGEIVVRTGSVDASRTNAGGMAYAQRDSAGCIRIFVGLAQFYVIENPPADTATFWSGFVRGYLYAPATPVCGADTVFHLVTRE
jgi:hypothetical protein